MRIRVFTLAAVLLATSSGIRARGQVGGALKLDFGNGPAEQGWVKVGSAEEYSDQRGYGFVGKPKLEPRDREHHEGCGIGERDL